MPNPAVFTQEIFYPDTLRKTTLPIALDLEYMQDRIRTHRAIHTRLLSIADGELFEAAVTLLEMFKIVLVPEVIQPSDTSGDVPCYVDHMKVEISPENKLAVVNITIMQIRDGHYQPYEFEGKYFFNTLQNGYIVSIWDVECDKTVYVQHNSSVYLQQNEEIIPYFAPNPDALRYCESFPIPTLMRLYVMDALRTLDF